MEDLLSTVSSLLYDIQQKTSSVIANAPQSRDHEPTGFCTQIPPLKLDIPSHGDIHTLLTAADVSPAISNELSQVHVQCCRELASQYSHIYSNMCSEASRIVDGRTMDDLRVFFSRLQRLHRMYDRTTGLWLAELISSVKEKPQCQAGPSTSSVRRSKRPFNAEYLPKLEAFFDRNPRPSRADKLFLAKQSGMSYRQISVWFQNHRARCLKINSHENNCIVDSNVHHDISYSNGNHTPSSASFTSLRKSSERTVVLEDTYSDAETVANVEEYDPQIKDISSRSSSYTLVEVNVSEDDFSTQTPAHAYPTPYPPTLHDIPFPCVYGDFSFPKPTWRRQAMVKVHRRTGAIDISELIYRFDRLSLASEASPERSDLQSFTQPKGTPFNAYPFITSTYSAPIPALVPCRRKPSERPFSLVTSTCSTPIKQLRNGLPSITQLCFLRPSVERDRISCTHSASYGLSSRDNRPEGKAPLLERQRYYKHLAQLRVRTS